MIYPPVLIVGESGSGKSRSILNLPPERTTILNIERKALPFKGSGKFKGQVFLDNRQEFLEALEEAKAHETQDIIVIESLTKYFELLLKSARVIGGYEGWAMYAVWIRELLELLKGIEDKFIFCLSREQIIDIGAADGQTTSRVVASTIMGKEMQGQLEPEFSVVLFTKLDYGNPVDNGRFNFTNAKESSNTAKAPEGMFDSEVIPNDLEAVRVAVESYYKG